MVDSAYVDGGSTALTTTKTSIQSLTTTLGAATNIVIAIVQLENTNSAARQIAVGDLELRRGTGGSDPLLTENLFIYKMTPAADTSPDKFAFLIGRDVSAPANPTYAVHAAASATGVNAEVKIVVISGEANTAYVDGGTITVTGSETTVATLTTTLPAPSATPAIIIAAVHMECQTPVTGRSETPVDGLRLKRGTTVLANNQFFVEGREGADGEEDWWALLIARDTATGANPTYTVTGIDDRAGDVHMNAEIVAFSGQPNALTDSGSVAIGTSRTVIASRTTTFAAGTDVIIGAFQTDNTNVAGRNIAVDAQEIQRAGATPDSGNQFLYHVPPAGNVAAIWEGYVFEETTTAANPTYEGAAAASATGVNADCKLVAIHIADTGGAALTKVQDSTENISEAINTVKGIIKVDDVTEQVTEAQNQLLGLVRLDNKTEQISETINLALRKTIDETANISETINLALRKTLDETIDTNEAINEVLGKTELANETEDITEAINEVLATALIEVINSTVEISEGVNLALRKTIDSTEEITEAKNQLLGLVRFANETENITEVENHVLIAPIVENINESVDITEAGDTIKFTNDIEISELINTVVAAAGGTQVVDETEDITEALNIQVGKQVDESQDITETVNLALRKVIDETANISETINLALRKTIDSTIDISEASDNVLGKVVVVPLETVDINEAENHVIAAIIIKNENEETEDISEAINTVLGLVRVVDTLEFDNLSVAQDSFGRDILIGQRLSVGKKRVRRVSIVFKNSIDATDGTIQGKIWKDATPGQTSETEVVSSTEIYSLDGLIDEQLITFTFPNYTVEEVEYVIGAEIADATTGLIGIAHTPDQITGRVSSRTTGNWIDVPSQDLATQIFFEGERQETTETINLSLRKVEDEVEDISESINLALRKTIDATEEINEAINSLILSALVEEIPETVNINEARNIQKGITQTVDEAENISETINLALRKIIDETANISESVVVAHRKNLDETENITENVNFIKIITLFSNDTVNISEAVNSIIRTPAVFVSRKVDAIIKLKSTEAIILKKTVIASLQSKTSTSALIFKKAIVALLHKKNTDAYVDE